MISLKLVQFDGSIGLLLPETVLRRLGAAQGDSLCLVETLEGYMLVSRDSEFVRQIEAADSVMHDEHDVLKELKK